jgi:hypothetical protein
MRITIFVFFVFAASCSSNTGVKNKQTNDLLQDKNSGSDMAHIINCDTIACDATVNNYLKSFNPSQLDLRDCMSDSMNSFLLSIDSNCLRSIPNYKRFVCGVLIKLYYYHMDCCHQSYDLFSMKVEGAKVLINEFQRIINVRQEDRDMLNSGIVFYFVQTDSILKKDAFLDHWVKKIKKNKNYIE